MRVVTGIFENAGMIVQPVDGGNDIGKDLYVDLAIEGVFSGEMIAVQVKSGNSYRARGGYRIPCTSDLHALWAGSPVPIFGTVFDLELERVVWINLTSWARAQPSGAVPSSARVESLWSLNQRTIQDFVREAHAYLVASGPPALLGLVDSNVERQRSAVYDAFALGRSDVRALILLRRTLLCFRQRAVYGLAIHLLSVSIGGHMDVFWRPINWIAEEIRAELRRHLDWTHDELCFLLTPPDPVEWDRGGLGQDVAALLSVDWGSRIERALAKVVLEADEAAARPALMLLASASGIDALDLLDELARESRTLLASALIEEFRARVLESGAISMW